MLKPLIELTIASAFWGFGFVGGVWALQSLSFAAVVFYRFLGAFAAGFLIWSFSRPSKADLHKELMLALKPGIWLAITILFQTGGLVTTTATKSAFITGLYVVFVPLLAVIIERQRPSKGLAAAVGLALIGTWLIADVEWGGFTSGDALTLANALAAAFHIRAVATTAPSSKSPFGFNVFQSLWTCVFCLPVLALEASRPDLFKGTWQLSSLSTAGWVGLASLTFGSSMIAFFLQVRAQAKINPTIASILFLLESPFSFVFAFFLLSERLNLWQGLGATLIMAACLFAIFLPEAQKSQEPSGRV